MALAAALLVLLQEDPRGLVERLRSDRVEEREEAARRLRALGEAARPALEAAASGGDPETAARAKEVLSRIDFRRRLGARLLAAVPGIEEKLYRGDDRAWLEAFLEAAGETGENPPSPALRGADLEPLAAGALRGMREPREFENVPGMIARYRIRSARPVLLELARSGDLKTLASCASAFADLAGRDDIPTLLRLAVDAPSTSLWTFQALVDLRARDRVPDVLPFLESRSPEVRREALQVLGALGAAEAAPEVLKRLDDENDNVRYWAIQTLAELRVKEAVPGITRFLRDPGTPTRREAAKALGELGARESIPGGAPGLRSRAGPHPGRRPVRRSRVPGALVGGGG